MAATNLLYDLLKRDKGQYVLYHYAGSGDAWHFEYKSIIDKDGNSVELQIEEQEELSCFVLDILDETFPNWQEDEGSEGMIYFTYDAIKDLIDISIEHDDYSTDHQTQGFEEDLTKK